MTWNELIVIDNSQQGESCGGTSTVTVNQVAGLPYGSDFPEGFHIVQYEATDGNGLKSTCSFYVIVESKCFHNSQQNKYNSTHIGFNKLNNLMQVLTK